jgi:O-antigen/teichoic acid export membrane protein
VLPRGLSLLLIPLFTHYLSPSDYGALALLALFSTLAKIVFRLGLDAGFFRVHYDQPDDERRRQLAGTIAVFGAVAGMALLAATALLAGPVSWALFGNEPAPARWVVLAAADVAVGTLAFVPLSLLRIRERPGLFSTFSVGRHLLNLLLKVVLVRAGWGVEGVLWSDLVATSVFVLSLLPTLRGHLSFAFAIPLLKDALGFGLPKVPHGLFVQIQNLADRKILDLFVPRSEVGLYQVAYDLGSGPKFATSAFEPAWGPFLYAEIKKPDAPRTIARLATIAFAVFALCAAGVASLGGEALTLLTPYSPEFRAAAPVIPVVACAYLLHGVFLLTSVGIGVSKRARYYPTITAVVAVVNVAANFLLIPRFGMMGAAWATLASYAVMAGMGAVISQRLYPIPFEKGRMAAFAAGALAVYVLGGVGPAALGPAIVWKGSLLALYASAIARGLRWPRRQAPEA